MATYNHKLASRIPSLGEVLPVFSTIAFFVYGWALYRFFYQVPSWLFYLQIWDILALACYVLAFALLESAIVLGLLIGLAIILPQKTLRANFTHTGSALAALLGLISFAIQRKIGLMDRLELWQLVLFPLLGLLGLVLSGMILPGIFKRVPVLERLVGEIASRMSVFAYIYPPLSVIGLLVVLMRNLF